MADTARSKLDTQEIFDDQDTLEAKVKQLAAWIRESRQSIAFTGAGISTAAGIPDFRSGMNTKLATGPGVWELRANKAMRPKKHKTKSSLKAMPTLTHMSLLALVQHEMLSHVVSQNTDGLHVRSGLTRRENLYELHGNTKLEYCRACSTEFLRDFRTREARKVHDHRTSRCCDKCQGRLRDSIINFGENLPEDMIDGAFDAAQTSELCIALGSSLTVTPAADIPLDVASHGRLVIINLQPTPLDEVAELRINGKCDDVMRLLMKELNVRVPKFELKRYLTVAHQHTVSGAVIKVNTHDDDNRQFSYLRSLTVDGRRLTREPFQARVAAKKRVKVRMEFFGHYNEPFLEFEHVLDARKSKMEYALGYDPLTGVWEMKKKHNGSEWVRVVEVISGVAKKNKVKARSKQKSKKKKKSSATGKELVKWSSAPALAAVEALITDYSAISLE